MVMGANGSKFTLKKAFYLVQNAYRNNYLLMISIGIVPMLLWMMLDNSISVVQENYNFSAEEGMVKKDGDGFDGPGEMGGGIGGVVMLGLLWLVATGVSTMCLIKTSILAVEGGVVKIGDAMPSPLEAFKYLALTMVIGLGMLVGIYTILMMVLLWLYLTAFSSFFLLSGAGVLKSIKESVHMVRVDYYPMLKLMMVIWGMSAVFSIFLPWWMGAVWIPIGWLFMATLFKYHTYNKQRMLGLGVKDEPDEF